MRTITRVLALCLAVYALPTLAVAPPKDRLQPHVPGQLIVRFRAEVRGFEREAQMLRLGARPVAAIGGGRQQLIALDRDADLAQAIARLEASGLVDYAHPNYYRRKLGGCAALAVPKLCPNDVEFGFQYHLHNPFLVGIADSDADIDMPQAWDLITGSNVLLAIIDDGFDLGHADLDANLSNGVRCEDGVGCGFTAAAGGSNDFHGTLVAGSAAAVGNNTQMVAGVLLTANVLPIRMPNYTTAEVILSVDYAIAQGARIINMSFGGPGFTQSEVDAIDRARTAGILVVAAAGNEDSNTDKAVASYPANYALDNILAVGASDSNDNMASFSTWGSFSVELAAPGSNIRTTNRGGGTDVVSGTSFSAPITAGAAALVGQYLTDAGNAAWDYRELTAYLLAGADDASDNGDLGLRGRVAAGRLNVHRSLQLVDSGLSGGVLVVRGLAFDDPPSLLATNDGDGQPDPGERFDLIVTLENAWDADTVTTATLSTADADATVVQDTDSGVAIGQYGTADVAFQVELGSFSTNEQILFRLDLVPQTGAPQTRYFYLEVGALANGVEKVQAFQRTNWDEFHAWHANVPAGATNVVFETHSNNAIDIDLIARRTNPPAYFSVLATSISTGGGTGEACAVSDPCIISGEADGEELIGDPSKPSTEITGTEPGTWHLVVVNFDQVSHSYRVKASWDAAGAGTVRFAAPTTATSEAAGSAQVQVVRSGGVGAVSVDYTITNGTATLGNDYTATAGTLTWADGDTAAKTLVFPILADAASEGAETFNVVLSDPTGGADIGRYATNTVTIASSTTGGGGGGGGGGGAGDALLLAGLAALLAARRRRARC